MRCDLRLSLPVGGDVLPLGRVALSRHAKVVVRLRARILSRLLESLVRTVDFLLQVFEAREVARLEVHALSAVQSFPLLRVDALNRGRVVRTVFAPKLRDLPRPDLQLHPAVVGALPARGLELRGAVHGLLRVGRL